MIQRIQSFYLLLTAIVSALFLKGSFLKIINSEGHEKVLRFSGIFLKTGPESFEKVGSMIPLTAFSILVPVTALITIFLYKNRKIQLKLTLLLIVFEILLILTGVYYFFSTIEGLSFSFNTGTNCLFPILGIVFTILAWLGIKRDEELVRSYDRLR